MTAGDFKKGNIPWNKGMKGFGKGHPFYGRRVWTPEQRAKLSEAHKGKSGKYIHTPEMKKKNSDSGKRLWQNPEYRKMMISASIGRKCPNRKPMSEETKIKIGLVGIGRTPPNKGKGYKCVLKQLIKHCLKYRKWRIAVFERDNYTCQKCKERGGILHPHHIKSLSQLLKETNVKTLEEAENCSLLWEVSNGQTLCRECHKQTDNYGFRKKGENHGSKCLG
jgi:hypothetical protein